MSDVPIYQAGLWGQNKRLTPWKNILRNCIRRIGDRPDLTEAEYNRKIAATFFSELPAMEDLLKAIIKKGDIRYAKKLVKAFFQLPTDDVPAPDTIARQTRTAKEELKKEGILERSINEEDEESFSGLLAEIEEESGKYNSSIEARFYLKIKKEFPDYRWEQNKVLQVQVGIYRGRKISPDILCEQLGLSIEIDSWEFHSNRDNFISDRQKSRIMQMLGYYHLQLSGSELSIPGGFSNAMKEITHFIEHRCLNNSAK
jgi:hypothetical protein